MHFLGYFWRANTPKLGWWIGSIYSGGPISYVPYYQIGGPKLDISGLLLDHHDYLIS